MLTDSQRGLVQQLLGNGKRWLIASPNDVGLRPRVVECAVEWLQQHTMRPDGGSGVVISPPSVMHTWWGAGWKDKHQTPQQLLRETIDSPTYQRNVSVVIDELLDYNDKIVRQLDELLQHDADNCLVFLPAIPPENFSDMVAPYGFKLLNLNATK